ncbi:hypothetical protein LNTAR_09019 [Lentisphaera araneosa HTCC2155]|uniref:Uncharacterized protein n=1 Tax=Lentisphaera araneosa HTCC2155 TaxID=313628 RepID=A6DI45_9BACT|nr:hypothetical protein [Lentisphaera araneosa]EDM28699.1 hypothetical protein LNTAR_09019 [Lentisphaera araneosa HTCC2155]
MNISAQKLWRLVNTSICLALLFLTQDIHSNGLTSLDRLLDITSPKGKELLDNSK